MCALRPGLWSGIFLFLSTLLILLLWKRSHTGPCVVTCDTCVSDHLPQIICLFYVLWLFPVQMFPRRQHATNPLTATQFSAASEDIVLYTLDISDLSADNLTILFNWAELRLNDNILLSQTHLQTSWEKVEKWQTPSLIWNFTQHYFNIRKQ